MKELIRTYFTLSKSDRLFRPAPPPFSDTFRDARETREHPICTRTRLRTLEYKYIRGLYTRMRTGWKVKSRASRKRNKETRGLFSPLFLFASSFFLPFLRPPARPSSLTPSHSLSPLFRSRIRGFLVGGLAAWQPLTENSN